MELIWAGHQPPYTNTKGGWPGKYLSLIISAVVVIRIVVIITVVMITAAPSVFQVLLINYLGILKTTL